VKDLPENLSVTSRTLPPVYEVIEGKKKLMRS
jgi:hypothetical protein